ncbi:MAG: hypothetical protein EA374_02925 [Acholeplasmatales bacterium]|nr:MAG: hypothetical protein EA374_02925 [Acholeplasmatales bacterium]
MASLKTTITVYNWVFKLTGAVLLIGLALILYFGQYKGLVEAFVGLLIGGYALMRLIPFIKTQRSGVIRTINIIEIIAHIAIAALFIFVGLTQENGLGNLFGYILGGVLIGRGMIHFYGVSSGHEKGDHPTYFFHVAALVVGTVVVINGYNVESIITLILVLSLGASLYLGYDAYGGYGQYRRRKQLEVTPQDVPVAETTIPKREFPAEHPDEIVQ